MLAAFLNLAIWAQGPRFNPNQPPGPDPAALGGILACFGVFMLIMAVFGLVMLVAMWKVFTKAGEPGWACIVPIYNNMIVARIAGQPEVNGLLACIPIIGLIWGFPILFDFCRAFGKGTGFAVAMIFFPFICIPILGFGSAEHEGNRGTRRKKKRRDDDYDDEEDDEPRRPVSKRRPSRDEDDEDDEPRRPVSKRRPSRDDEEDEDEAPPRKPTPKSIQKPPQKPAPKRNVRREEDDD
jgi:hypothetical protein